jgi:hypothetical protein
MVAMMAMNGVVTTMAVVTKMVVTARMPDGDDDHDWWG